jgi:CBS domain-containing protein
MSIAQVFRGGRRPLRLVLSLERAGVVMRVLEVMTEGVQTAPPTMSAGEATEIMRRQRIRHLVVTRGRGIVGVLSERDAGGRSGASIRVGRTVADLMTAPVVTVAPTDTVRSVANVMRGRTIGCVPVVDRGRLVGIVTLSDLLELLGRGVDRPATPARRLATHRVPHRKGGRTHAAW